MDFFRSAGAVLRGGGSSGSAAFPFAWDSKAPPVLKAGPATQSLCSVYDGRRKDGNMPCTIFCYDTRDGAASAALALAHNAAKRGKTIRYPGLIEIYGVHETDREVYIATERVVPLIWRLRHRNINPDVVRLGLYTLAKAVAFLNDQVSAIHGNIRLSSVFITESEEFRLAGFELLSVVTEETPLIYDFGQLLPTVQEIEPPEIRKDGWLALKRYPLHCLDAWQFGRFIHQIYNYQNSAETAARGDIPSDIYSAHGHLTDARPQARMSVSHFVQLGLRPGGFFSSPLIEFADEKENLALKSAEEQTKFYKSLEDVLDRYSPKYVQFGILPTLLKAFEFAGAHPACLALILRIGESLSPEDYDDTILTMLVRMFSSPERTVRLCLLNVLPSITDRLTVKLVNDKVWPHFQTGFYDSAPQIREQTIRAVIPLAPKLSERVLNNNLLKLLAKTQQDEQPGIRTNTTICLGKIAKDLNPSTRQKILVPAFTRVLRDPFVHARIAGLLALIACADYFELDDCAVKILPSVCPLLMDQEKAVRTQTGKTIDIYIVRTNKLADTLPEGPATPSAVPCSQPRSASGLAAVGSGASPTKTQAGSLLTSAGSALAGWAVDALLKIDEPSPTSTQLRTGSAPPAAASSAAHIQAGLPADRSSSKYSARGNPMRLNKPISSARKLEREAMLDMKRGREDAERVPSQQQMDDEAADAWGMARDDIE